MGDKHLQIRLQLMEEAEAWLKRDDIQVGYDTASLILKLAFELRLCIKEMAPEYLTQLLEETQHNFSENERLHQQLNDILHPDGDGPPKPSLCDLIAYVRDDLQRLRRITEMVQEVEERAIPVKGGYLIADATMNALRQDLNYNRGMIQSPARCNQCHQIFEANTTGVLYNCCMFCGSTLTHITAESE